MQTTAETVRSCPRPQTQHVYSRKNAHVGSGGSWASSSPIRDHETSSALTKGQGKRNTTSEHQGFQAHKVQKACSAQSPGKAVKAHSQLSMESIVKLLVRAHSRNTNAGSTTYKDDIQQ